METLIAEGIGKTYKGRQVVRGVDLKISRGEVVGLLGPNGAGKTTSFYIIVGLVAPETGRVLVDETDITRLPMYLRARNFGISYLPQEPSVFRKLTVEENILAVLEAQPLGNRERRTRAERLISQLNLGHIRTTRGYALSGGERRRVEIARCALHPAQFHPARRALQRHRSDRGAGAAEDHLRPEGRRHRRSDYRPQRARDAQRNRPGVHYCRGKDYLRRNAARAGQRPGRAARLSGRGFLAGLMRAGIGAVTVSRWICQSASLRSRRFEIPEQRFPMDCCPNTERLSRLASNFSFKLFLTRLHLH